MCCTQAGVAPDLHLATGASLSATMREAFETNVVGAAATAQNFAPLLERSSNPRVIFMSSGQGSLTRVAASGGKSVKDWPAYSASKAALNMVMLWFAGQWSRWRVNSCAPGYRVGAFPLMG